MRLISFGDLYVDYYFKNDELIGLCGGKTNANILVNLVEYFNTAFYGVVGNDVKGEVAIKSLSTLGVDVSGVNIVEADTKTFFINDEGYSKECPYCHRRIGYHGTKFDSSMVLDKIEKDDVIIVDNLNVATIEILNSVDNMAFIDIGSVYSLKYMSLDEIESILSNRFKIINMNESVYNFIKRKFAIDSLDLYNLLNPDILIITRGRRGVDIVANGEFYKKEIDNPALEVDVSGAGDAFFSEFIKVYLNSEIVDEKMLSSAYMKAQSNAAYVVSLIGARSHIQPLFKIDNYKECICSYFKVNNL